MSNYLICILLTIGTIICKGQSNSNELTFKVFLNELKFGNDENELRTFFIAPISDQAIDSLILVCEVVDSIDKGNIGYYSIKVNMLDERFMDRVFNTNIYMKEPYKDLFDLRIIVSERNPRKIEFVKVFDNRVEKEKNESEKEITFPPPPPPPPMRK